jgi:predicted GTPase
MDDLLKKLHTAADQAAQQHNLKTNVVLNRLPPIDIFVFGRSGIGKSTLIEGITNEKVFTSAQLDHVTEQLTEVNKTIGTLKFRFWDTKGIDNWREDDTFNLIIQMKDRDIKPIFAIYCAAAGGRVDSNVVTAILQYFQLENIPICYVMTNI